MEQPVDNAEIIRSVMTEPLKILRDKYSFQLNDLSEREVNEIYSSLPLSSFTDSRGHYHKNLSDKSNEFRKGQLKTELLSLWREVAGNKLSSEWSKIHRTPIMAMVPKSEQSEAEKVFRAVSAKEQNAAFAFDEFGKSLNHRKNAVKPADLFIGKTCREIFTQHLEKIKGVFARS